LSAKTSGPVRYDAFMPRLACWSCGRQIYTVAPLESLFYEERRCPRCGAFLNAERRDWERRSYVRRQNAADDPGPPKPRPPAGKTKTDKPTKTAAKATKAENPDEPDKPGKERRAADRRLDKRRQRPEGS
jgi:ribosomal protein S27AE